MQNPRKELEEDGERERERERERLTNLLFY